MKKHDYQSYCFHYLFENVVFFFLHIFVFYGGRGGDDGDILLLGPCFHFQCVAADGDGGLDPRRLFLVYSSKYDSGSGYIRQSTGKRGALGRYLYRVDGLFLDKLGID